MSQRIGPARGHAALSLILIVAGAYEALRSAGLGIHDIMVAAGSLEKPRRERLEALARVLGLLAEGDLTGAIEELSDPERAAMVLEGARILEEEFRRKPVATATAIAQLAEEAVKAGLEPDSIALYLEAAARLVASRLGHPVSQLDAARLAETLSGSPLGVSSLFGEEECFPRRYCPPRLGVFSAGSARKIWESLIEQFDKAPIENAYYEKVEKPRIERLAKLLIGDLPGLAVVNRPGSLEPVMGAVYVIYDNTDPGVARIVASSGSIPIPLFRGDGLSLEDIWRERQAPLMVARMRDLLYGAPLYALVLASWEAHRASPGRPAQISIREGVLRLRLPPSGRILEAGLREAASRFREILGPLLVGARSLEGIKEGLVEALHRFYYCRAG